MTFGKVVEMVDATFTLTSNNSNNFVVNEECRLSIQNRFD